MFRILLQKRNLAILTLIVLVMLAVNFYYKLAYQQTIKGNFSAIRAPLIVFDFDGTICPSYPLFIDLIKEWSKNKVIKEVTTEEVDEFKNLPPKELMKACGVSSFKLPFLLKNARDRVQEKILELEPRADFIGLLNDLKAKGYSLGILTSNSKKNVTSYLKKYEINDFDFVFTSNHVFGKEKSLEKICKKTGINPEQDLIVYIGDEVRDIEAAKKAKFISIGVSWGYNSETLLRNSCPDYLCNTFQELILSLMKLHKIEFQPSGTDLSVCN